MPDQIAQLYGALVGKAEGSAITDLKGDVTSARLKSLAIVSRGFLNTLSEVPLLSKVAGKKYFMFRDEARGKVSRPVNDALYLRAISEADIHQILFGDLLGIDAEVITQRTYTIAISYCCAADILKNADQKTPGTFFEILIGHLVARALGTNPEKQVLAPTLDLAIRLPTDFVFDLGGGKNRVHLPVKISTRERVVQVWAHQRVLDGMHGVGRFKGVLVAMAETNKQKDISVTEVCLPNQWVAYQMYIAQMFRIYYLDIPDKYFALKTRYPFIQVKPFGEFFNEINLIESSGVG